MQQDLIGRLLERKPARRLGMLNGRANDIKKHKWFEGLDWEALEARKIAPLRKPKEDSAKRLKELTVSVTAQPCTLGLCNTGPLICSESTGSNMHSWHAFIAYTGVSEMCHRKSQLEWLSDLFLAELLLRESVSRSFADAPRDDAQDVALRACASD